MADNSEMLKVLEAKRMGSGEWMAVVDLMRWNLRETEAGTIKCWHEKHPTREAALEAVKRMITEHASAMALSTSLEWEDIAEGVDASGGG